MTTTSTFSGINEDAKTSSRVLKPPGGGSSDIFGPGEPSPTHKHRPGPSKPSEAGVFKTTSESAVKSAAQRSARDGDDSFNRLFGECVASPQQSQKGTSASPRVSTHANLFGTDMSTPEPRLSPQTNSTYDHIFGENDAGGCGEGRGSRYSDQGRGHYNPITGADYKDLAPNHHALHVKEPPKPQKEQPPLPCSDGEYQAKGGKMQNVQTSTRISNPPGGKTHRLW